MIDFQVGDPVVCVDDEPRDEWLDVPGYLEAVSNLRVGHVYRIVRIDIDDRFEDEEPLGLSLDGIPDGPGDPDGPADMPVSWGCSRFRKVLKADERFTEQMRALKPQQVSA